MLLLFWGGTEGFNGFSLTPGIPYNIRWYHSTGYPPRCICGTASGISIINPYYPQSLNMECSYALINKKCTGTDVYNNDLVIGTELDGLFKTDWATIKSKSMDIGEAQDLTSFVQEFTTFSGLLSNEIIAVEANGDYLGIVTSSGFCYGRPGEAEYLNYVTQSGKDCYVRSDNYVYFAEGNRILCKESPGNFTTWEGEYNFPYDINDIWVTSKDDTDTIFVGTEGGPYVVRGNDTYDYTDIVVGSKNIISVSAEYDSTYNWGHLFTAAEGIINIINLKSKLLENSISYSGSTLFAAETQRLYSK